MPNPFEKPYQPSPEEVKKAKEVITEEQKEASEERVKSLEQKEQLPPILIIYRDNDLFKNQITEMVKNLSSMGRKVEVQNFPVDTKKEEIENWYIQNKNSLSGKEIISDWTASVPFSLREELTSKGIQERREKLDSFINEAARRAILGDKYENILKYHEENWTEELAEEFFTTIIGRILENKENMPDRVVIFLDNILDHLSYDKNELFKKLGLEGRMYKELNDDQKRNVEELAAEKLKKWLAKGGIIDYKFIIQKYKLDLGYGEFHKDESSLKHNDLSNYWVIADRHAGLSQDNFKKAKYLALPEGNFYETAIESGLIDMKQEELAENLKKVLEENFSKKYEPEIIQSAA